MNPSRVATTIQDPKDHGFARKDPAANRIGETPREQSLEPASNRVNARVQYERVNLGEQAVVKVVPHALFLPVIKASTSGQILEGRTQDPDLHSVERRNCFLAASQ